MKYTIRQGVERAFSERIRGNLQILLPLLVILAGVTAWALMPHGKTQKPQTLGIYTIKTPDQNNSSDTGSADKNKAGGNSTGGLSVNGRPSTISSIAGGGSIGGGTSLGSATSPVSAAVPPVTGGMGGGGGGGTVSNTISCTNLLTQSGQVCIFPYQYCTPPLGQLGVWVKTTDGTCIKIN